MEEIIITKMKREHISEIAQIEEQCFSTPWSENSLAEELSNPTAFFVVALLGGKAAGYGGMNCIVDVGYIDNIAVLENMRGRGIGKLILKSFLNAAREKNLCELTLEVRQSNAAAIGLYSSFGFEVMGKRRNFYTKPAEDGIIMTKRINNL